MKSTGALMIPDEAGAAINRAAVCQAEYNVGTAATAAITEIAFFCAPFDCVVSKVYYLPTAVSTPSAGSNSQALAVTKYDGAGGAGAAMATASIANATPTAAYVPFSLGTLTGAAMSKGNVLSFKSTLTGTATVPTGVLVVEYAPN